MSDVNIKTSWDDIPANDSEYNTVLGCAGYDDNDNRLFLSAQQVPNIARNVTTEYARGFRIERGYAGNVIHDAITETAAELKTVKFTMSTAGTSYDLEDARLYVQFKNKYSIDIASWSLQHEAEDDTLTTLASGTTIAAGAAVQVDFKNDYGKGRFFFTITYEGGPAQYHPRSGYWIQVEPRQTVTLRAGGETKYFVNESYTTQCWLCHASALPQSTFVATWLPISQGRMSYRYNGQLFSTEGSFYYDGNTYRYGNTSWNWYTDGVTADGELFPNSTFSNNNQACTEFYNGTWSGGSGGLNTSDLNEYTGDMWQCRLLANIAAISPGPMATESEGGTEGDFDVTSDQITAPALPTTITVGGVRLYRVTAAQLNEFRDYIWNPDILNSLFNNFSDRANGIMSIMQMPTATYPDIAAGQHILIGSSEVYYDDLQGRHYATGTTISRYGQVDCGTVSLNLFWDSALDLNPYTKLTAYIPCVGTVPLNADEVMGHTIGLYYNIDFLSGAGVAVLTIDGDYLAQYPCNMSTPIGISGEQFSRVYQSMIAAMASGAIGYAAAGTGGALAGAMANTASALMTSKIDRERAGNFGAGTALMAQLQPYIEILRPIQQLPRNYTHFNAYPSYMTAQLINLSGWTEIQDIYIDDIDCTEPERADLLALLQSGIIL